MTLPVMLARHKSTPFRVPPSNTLPRGAALLGSAFSRLGPRKTLGLKRQRNDLTLVLHRSVEAAADKRTLSEVAPIDNCFPFCFGS